MSKLQIKVKQKLELPNIKRLTIKAGFPIENQETLSLDEDNKTALEKANINNFGLGVPKRPFMMISFYENQEKYNKIVKDNFKNIKNFSTYTNFMNKLGLVMQNDIQTTIVKIKSPANSSKTIEEKGSSNPLIDTGHMLQSVTYQIKKGV